MPIVSWPDVTRLSEPVAQPGMAVAEREAPVAVVVATNATRTTRVETAVNTLRMVGSLLEDERQEGGEASTV